VAATVSRVSQLSGRLPSIQWRIRGGSMGLYGGQYGDCMGQSVDSRVISHQ